MQTKVARSLKLRSDFKAAGFNVMQQSFINRSVDRKDITKFHVNVFVPFYLKLILKIKIKIKVACIVQMTDILPYASTQLKEHRNNL